MSRASGEVARPAAPPLEGRKLLMAEGFRGVMFAGAWPVRAARGGRSRLRPEAIENRILGGRALSAVEEPRPH